MDDKNLDHLIQNPNGRQFWIKPVGHPDLPVDEHRPYDAPIIRIEFANNPLAIKGGDILIVYRIKISKLIYVAEALSTSFKTTDEEIRKEPWRLRWPWIIEAKNLTPEYGASWARYSLKPFALAKEYNQEDAVEKAKIGGLKFGSDKLRISQGFALFMLKKIRQLHTTGV